MNKIFSKKEVKIITEYKSLKGLTEEDIRFIEGLVIAKVKEKIIPKLKKRIKIEVFPIKMHQIGDTKLLGECYKIIEQF